jgi:hypothetical protein
LLAELHDGAQHLPDELGKRRRLRARQDRGEMPTHRGRTFGDDSADDLVLALEVAVNGTGRQAAKPERLLRSLQARRPPSTDSAMPVTYDASGGHNHMAATATSSGWRAARAA